LDLLVALEIGGQRFQQPVHGDRLLFEDVQPHRGQGVGQGPHADAWDVRGIVARSAVVIVAAPFDAVVHQQRHVRGGHVVGKEPLDRAVAGHLQVDKILQLGLVRLEELLVRDEPARVARLRAKSLAARDAVPPAGGRVDAVVAGQLENLRPVDVPGQRAAFLAEGTDGHATAGSAEAGVGQRLAVVEHLLEDHVGIKDRRLPQPGANHAAGAFQEAVGVPLAELDAGARLDQLHLFHDVEHQIGDFINCVAAVGLQAADVDQGEVGIGAALFLGNADLRRRRLVVELDPEALQQLLGQVPGERTVFEPLNVERIEVLVEPARVERIPRVQLRNHTQVDEPVGLQGFVEIARGVRGDPGTGFGDPQQLLAADRVGLPVGHFGSQRGVPLGERHDGVATDLHGLVLFVLLVGLPVPEVVELCPACGDLLFDFEEPAVIDLVVQDGVSRGPLLHELGKDTRLEGPVPRLGHQREEPVANRPPRPERDDLLLVNLHHLVADGKRGPLAAVEDLQVFEAVAAEFGIGGRGLGGGASLADDQFALIDANRPVFNHVLDRHRPDNRGGDLGDLAAAVEPGDQLGPLRGNTGIGFDALAAQTFNSRVHGGCTSVRVGLPAGIRESPYELLIIHEKVEKTSLRPKRDSGTPILP